MLAEVQSTADSELSALGDVRSVAAGALAAAGFKCEPAADVMLHCLLRRHMSGRRRRAAGVASSGENIALTASLVNAGELDSLEDEYAGVLESVDET